MFSEGGGFDIPSLDVDHELMYGSATCHRGEDILSRTIYLLLYALYHSYRVLLGIQSRVCDLGLQLGFEHCATFTNDEGKQLVNIIFRDALAFHMIAALNIEYSINCIQCFI